MKKIRIFLANEDLQLGSEIEVEGNNFEYLSRVMRQRIGDKIFVFNGVDGEFLAELNSITKKSLNIRIIQKISDLKKVANITLAFALIKGARIDYIAEKATELGVARFQPIITQHTISDKINYERFRANVKEACEQCERNDFPEIVEVKKLEKFLLTSEAIILFCDESGKGEKASSILDKIKNLEEFLRQEIVILIGPEGGFSEDEFCKIRKLKNCYSLSLGPRILRADTAVVAALALVQEFLGDFN